MRATWRGPGRGGPYWYAPLNCVQSATCWRVGKNTIFHSWPLNLSAPSHTLVRGGAPAAAEEEA